jgi:hypothetical protein
MSESALNSELADTLPPWLAEQRGQLLTTAGHAMLKASS